jgi:hypothetical protein
MFGIGYLMTFLLNSAINKSHSIDYQDRLMSLMLLMLDAPFKPIQFIEPLIERKAS